VAVVVRGGNVGTGGDDMGGARRASSAGGVGQCERTAMGEGAADGENDTEGHGSGEDGCHARDDGFDRILNAGRFHDEPEDDIGHVDDPDGGVEVEAVTEHELPWAERFRGQ